MYSFMTEILYLFIFNSVNRISNLKLQQKAFFLGLAIILKTSTGNREIFCNETNQLSGRFVTPADH